MVPGGLSLLQPMAEITILVTLGMACRTLGILSESGTKQLAALVMRIVLPAMIFVSLARSDLASMVQQGPVAFLAGAVVPIVGYAIGVLVARLLRLEPQQASVVRVNASFSNTAFVGIPVCTALWGVQGTVLAVLYDQGLNLPLLTLASWGYGMSSRKATWRQVLLNPLLWSAALGLAWALVGLGLDGWLANVLTTLSNATIPLSLLVAGAMIQPGSIPGRMVLPLTGYVLARLVLVPLGAWLLALAVGLQGVVAGVIILQAAMPASVMATLMAEQYGADARLAATGAFLSVLLSFITLPLLAMLVIH